MPENTVKVDRSTRWGNPFRADEYADAAKHINPHDCDRKTWMREMAAEAFAEWVRDEATAEWKAEVARELAGKNLACWCPRHTYCHADVLLQVANPSPMRPNAELSRVTK